MSTALQFLSTSHKNKIYAFHKLVFQLFIFISSMQAGENGFYHHWKRREGYGIKTAGIHYNTEYESQQQS